jgi:hypothetical protein
MRTGRSDMPSLQTAAMRHSALAKQKYDGMVEQKMRVLLMFVRDLICGLWRVRRQKNDSRRLRTNTKTARPKIELIEILLAEEWLTELCTELKQQTINCDKPKDK